MDSKSKKIVEDDIVLELDLLLEDDHRIDGDENYYEEEFSNLNEK